MEIRVECDRPNAKLPRLDGVGKFTAWLVSGDHEWKLRSYEMMALCPDVVACIVTPSETYKRAVRSVSNYFVINGNWFKIDFGERLPLLHRMA
jgi:hypothetical protein